jgi:hypothetical protein
MPIAGSFAKWYVAKLKAYPIITNVGSAFVLMTTGDVLAQELQVVNGPQSNKSPRDQRLSLDRCDTAIGPITSMPATTTFNNRQTTTMGTSSAAAAASWQALVPEEFWFWDPFRTGTMAAWSVGIYTPFYVGLYRLYDRYLPKQTPASIAARVVLSFVCSIPVNAAFYVYGTAVHHTTEWWSLRQELLQLEQLQEDVSQEPKSESAQKQILITNNNNNNNIPPYHGDQLWAKARRKLESELPNTILTSGSCWIPINLFTFTMVPSHLRPLSLMFFSVFWNCYLSLSQHRELTIPKPTPEDPSS